MTKPKYGVALSRSEVARISNAVRWNGQSELLAEAIAAKVCQDCSGPITFKKKPTWSQVRNRLRCYDCGGKVVAARQKLKRLEKMPDSRGYMDTWHEDKKLAEHRVKAMKAMGRELLSTELVHHINGDRADNRSVNLLICTKGYHSDLHWRMRRSYVEEHPEYTGSLFDADKLYMKEHFSQL